ncbi:MAG: hypothetical protein WBP61_14540, partial [Nocardioides sp.]
MMSPQAEIAEAPAREEPHLPPAVLSRAFARLRAGAVTEALADLDGVRQSDWDGLDDLSRAALLTATIDGRLARGDLTEAQAHGEALGALLDSPGTTGATAHFGRAELAAATGDPETAAGHLDRVGLLLGDHDDPARLPWRAAAALTAVRLGHRPEA